MPKTSAVPRSTNPQPELRGDETFYIVLNTGSGKHQGDEVQDSISKVLNAAGRQFKLLKVKGGDGLAAAAQQAVELAKANRGVVVAAGGDGTLNAVSNAVLGTGLPFAILPQGTFNYFGRTYGISQDTETATRCMLDAVIQPVQVGMLNDKVFLVNASLGLYPTLLEDRESYKQRYGRSRWVALWSAMVTLFRAHRQLSVQLDFEGKTRTLRTQTIVVGNNSLQLEHIGVHEEVELQRDHLVAMTAKPLSTLALYGLVARGLLSRMGEADNLISFGFKKMTVRLGPARKRIKVAMDGEIFWLRAPLEFRVPEEYLPLLVPRDDAQRERA
ncbi:MAG TPA: diacylglycerol kinase [Pseudomonas sabulinigri]|uniref:DAGKc domain-containing protein n=1 Tax=marine sediment metagenome TaxID=412755 RepID=A0A0F9YTL1_9ZZZZ|nr:diacylglycerol kinase [Halopseudomonas sabulinigri]HEC51839.1 diacylglycerol kinase [Halopseudomonas sabulinigri]|tara:strand:- start:40418 stop:41404 length:987 start_codon:yes stop_codon:yes gene_type:complete